MTCFKQNKTNQNKVKMTLYHTNLYFIFTIFMLIVKKKKKIILNLTAPIEWLKDALQNQHLVVTASTSRG